MGRFIVWVLVLAVSGGVKALGAEDVDRLRAQVTLLRKEVVRLAEEVKELRAENAALRTANAALPGPVGEKVAAKPAQPAAAEKGAGKQRQYTLADFPPRSEREAAIMIGGRVAGRVEVVAVTAESDASGQFMVLVADPSNRIKGRSPNVFYVLMTDDQETALALKKGDQFDLTGEIERIDHLPVDNTEDIFALFETTNTEDIFVSLKHVKAGENTWVIPGRVPQVRKIAYNAIRLGMSYDRVVEIIELPGEEIASSQVDGVPGITPTIVIKIYSWRNSDGSSMQGTFQNDRLVSKTQFGLK